MPTLCQLIVPFAALSRSVRLQKTASDKDAACSFLSTSTLASKASQALMLMTRQQTIQHEILLQPTTFHHALNLQIRTLTHHDTTSNSDLYDYGNIGLTRHLRDEAYPDIFEGWNFHGCRPYRRRRVTRRFAKPFPSTM